MKLSIIIPFHKGIHFLEDCFESIREQGLTSFETILVLDHVKEDISSFMKEYQDLNLKVIDLCEKDSQYRQPIAINENEALKGCSGVASARNAGLDAADGEYVCFLDSDDYIINDALSKLLQAAEEQNADFIYGRKNSTWFRRKVYLASIVEKAEITEKSEETGKLNEEGKSAAAKEKSDQNSTDQENIYPGSSEVTNTSVNLTQRQKKILMIHEKLTAASVTVSESTAIAEAYYSLFVTGKGIGTVSVLGILFRSSFLTTNQLRFNESYIFYSDLTFMIQALLKVKVCAYVPEAIYVKRNHNDPVNYPALSQIKNVDRFDEYLQTYQQARDYTKEDSPLRSYLEDKLILYFTDTFALKLRGNEKEIWSTDRFQAMHELMLNINRDKMKSLNGYKKYIIKALLRNNAGWATTIVTLHLGIKKYRKIRENNRIFSYYLYNKVFSRMSVKDNWVMCETFLGKSYSDSPKYIYEYLNKNYRGKYRFIWVVNQKTRIPYHPVIVKRFSIRYCYYIARCKYFVFNGRQPEWYRKREGMVFLETWHGTPLKKLVFDQEEVMGATPLYKAQFYGQSRKWDYLVAANRFSAETFRSAFLFDKEMLEYGYPRNDILHSPDKDRIANQIKRELKIPEDKKTILYAPTWRDDEYYGPGEYKFALKLDLQLLKQELGGEYLVLLRTHYFIADSIDVAELEGFVVNVSRYDDISELYLISDILITDYSSVFFDYANLKRPILFYTYDLDKYRDMLRGFYMDMENEVPGPLLFTSEEVVEAIRNIDSVKTEYKEKYDVFYEKFCSLEDGHASENIVKSVFDLSK